MLDCHLSGQLRYLGKLQCLFAWQAKFLVKVQ